MTFYSQVVADALRADIPKIRGMIDGKTIRRLLSYRGEGGHRVFTFDVIGDLSYRRVVGQKDRVALARDDDQARMVLNLQATKAVLCPCCGLEVLGFGFWDHYDLFHARRPGWLNQDDCPAMGVTYETPPEQT